MNAPALFHTERLTLRKPTTDDAECIFLRYAADPEVTRYLSWTVHQSIDDTRAFLAWSDKEWATWPAGPYVITARNTGRLLGSTGFMFHSATVATTGYALARDAWGFGYATEALQAIVEISPGLGVRRLEAACHAKHRLSARVLEKCGFLLEALIPDHTHFPNLGSDVRSDVLMFSLTLE